MADEAVNTQGSFATLQSASSVGDGAFSGGSLTDVAGALPATEEDYPLLDLQLGITVGTPTENGTVDVYRRPKADGTNSQPAPAGSYAHEYVGSFVMDNTAPTVYFYLFGVPNVDKNAYYYLYNNDGTNTLTMSLLARGRSLEPAA